MTMIEQPKQHIRINVSTSVKGVHTFDVTVEMVDTPVIPWNRPTISIMTPIVWY